MNNQTTLDPALGCHPLLPANVPVDVVRFASLLPVSLTRNGAREKASIPLGAVITGAFATIEASSNAHRISIAKVAGASTPLMSSSWKLDESDVGSLPSRATILNIGKFVLDRTVTIGGQVVSVDLDASAIRELSEGRPTLLRTTAGDEEPRDILVEPDLPLSDGDYLVFLDANGQSRLFAEGELNVVGFGTKKVLLSPEIVETFLKTGDADTTFLQNDNASLRLVKHPEGAPAPEPYIIRRSPGGETQMVGAGLNLNFAEKVSPQFNTTSSALMGPAPTGFGSRPLLVLGNNASPPPPPGGFIVQPQPNSFPPPSPPGVGTGQMPPPPPPVIPQFPIVLYVPYLQTWELTGYSRGALLNTVSLGPQEETTIEVFSWERRKMESEDTTATELEQLLEGTVHNKDAVEVVDDSRRVNGWKLNAGLDVEIPSSPVGGSLDFEAKDELTTNAKTTTNMISEATQKASTRMKSTRQTKVVETSEFGTETKVVRRLRNPNLGRTLNLDIFEVMAHYDVTTRVDIPRVRLAVLAQMYDFLGPIITKGPDQYLALLNFQHIIEPALPKSLRAGFAAARLLLAQKRHCTYKCAEPCTCSDGGDTGNKNTNKPATREGAALAEITDSITRVRSAINQIAAADVATLGRTIKQHWDNWPGNPAGQPPVAQWEAARAEAKRFLFRRFVMMGPASRFWSESQRFAAGSGTGETAARQIVAARKVQGIDSMNTVSAFLTLNLRVVAEFAGLIVSQWPLVAPDLIGSGLGFDDAGLETALSQLQSALETIDTERGNATADNTKNPKSGEDPIANVTKKDEDEGYTPRALALASIDFDVLIAYLSNNANAFRTRLWLSIDSADRLRFLTAYGTLGTRTTGRILGFSGTSAILELDTEADAELAETFRSSVSGNGGLMEVKQVFESVLPTPGVTLDARLGACDALEPYLTESRAIELQRLSAVAQQEAQEVQRMKDRIGSGLLDDPKRGASHIVLDKPQS